MRDRSIASRLKGFWTRTLRWIKKLKETPLNFKQNPFQKPFSPHFQARRSSQNKKFQNTLILIEIFVPNNPFATKLQILSHFIYSLPVFHLIFPHPREMKLPRIIIKILSFRLVPRILSRTKGSPNEQLKSLAQDGRV